MNAMSLLVRVAGHSCAIPLEHVNETMRPLPIEPMAGTPPFVAGVSIVRGAPVPVVDLQALLHGTPARTTYERFVTVDVGERSVALGVGGVIGVRSLALAELEELPSLLRDAGAAHIQAIGAQGEELLIVLRAAKLVPDDVWNELTPARAR